MEDKSAHLLLGIASGLLIGIVLTNAYKRRQAVTYGTEWAGADGGKSDKPTVKQWDDILKLNNYFHSWDDKEVADYKRRFFSRINGKEADVLILFETKYPNAGLDLEGVPEPDKTTILKVIQKFYR